MRTGSSSTTSSRLVPSVTVMRGLSTCGDPGETAGRRGKTGSGKSHELAACGRSTTVSGGAVRVGGHDVRDVEQDSLAASIGLVREDSSCISTP